MSLGCCLYCCSPANSLEHVLPAAFGEFENAPMLENRICDECNNNTLGNLDQQLARCGPEGFLRRFYGVQGRKRREKVNPFYRGSAGGQRLEFKAFDPVWNVEVNLEVENGQFRQSRELIILQNNSGKIYHLPIREGSTADQLRQEFKKLDVVGPFEMRLSVAPDERTWVEPLLKRIWPAIQFGEPVLGSTVLEGATGYLQLTSRYFRSMAKIGFHYFLTQFNTYTGHEKFFSPLRRFISGDVEASISLVNHFVGIRQWPLLGEMLAHNARPDGWRAHLVCAEARSGECLAHLQMFLTEDWEAPTYTIRLASDAEIIADGAFGHSYHYYRGGRRGKFSGEAIRLRTERVTFVPPPLAPAVESK